MKFNLPAVFSVVMALMTTSALAQDWVDESNGHTQVVLEAQAPFAAESASGLGLEDFDAEIMDLRPQVYERARAANQQLLMELRERHRTAKHPKVIQDLEILRQSVEDQIHSAELQRRYMLPYFNIPQSVYTGFRGLLDPRNESRRYPAALERLRKYTGATGGQPVTELAIERTIERFDTPGLIGPYKGQIERDLDNIPRYQAGLVQLFEQSGLDGWQEGLETLNAQLGAYGEWLRAQILPRARKDHLLPAEIYADNLKNFGVRAEPADLIRIAQFGFQEIRGAMRSIARQIADQRGWENGELMHVMRELKKNQIPPDQILAVYRKRLSAVEDLIRANDVVTLPERPANIRLATEAESARIPAPFMSPPQLIGNTGQYGEFVLVQSNLAMEGEEATMDDWSHDAVTWALTVHEARPGHEMQFAALVENGTSQARAIYAFNSANVEGWGLYSEAIMQQYLPLEGQLFTLLARLQRAARMFLDPMVNLGLMSPEDAVEFMVEQVGLSAAMANSEADRYAFLLPGQATSYFYGYMNLQRLRTEVEMKLGERFEPRPFHDFILRQGLLPPDLLRQAVLEEFIPAQ